MLMRRSVVFGFETLRRQKNFTLRFKNKDLLFLFEVSPKLTVHFQFNFLTLMFY